MAADIKEVFSKDHDDLKPLEKTKKNYFACEIIFTNGGGRIRTAEPKREQIYSLPRLATSLPLRYSLFYADCRSRTRNLLITIQLLYQLS